MSTSGTKSSKGQMHEWRDQEAPKRPGKDKDRRCSMGDRCLTKKQCGEAGKIRVTKQAKGVSEDWGEINLCSLCEYKWSQSLQTIYDFTGIPKRGKGGAHELANLATIRNARGLSQYSLAEKSGVHRNYIQKVELKYFKANTHQAAKLAEALGVEVSELRGDS